MLAAYYDKETVPQDSLRCFSIIPCIALCVSALGFVLFAFFPTREYDDTIGGFISDMHFLGFVLSACATCVYVCAKFFTRCESTGCKTHVLGIAVLVMLLFTALYFLVPFYEDAQSNTPFKRFKITAFIELVLLCLSLAYVFVRTLNIDEKASSVSAQYAPLTLRI